MDRNLKFHFPNLYEFYLIAVFICYPYFTMYFRVHYVFGTLWLVSFLIKFVVGVLEPGEK